MANIIKRVWNQNRMVQIEDLRGMTFQAEAAGHTFQISGIDDDGNTVVLTGTPSGVLLRPDNTDVALTCSVSGGVVSATLPANCYDVPGRFGLTIFITSGSSKTAIYAAVGTVTRTSSGTVAPGTSQSVVDLINAINAAINSIPASYSALLADIAPTYSDSALYSVGQYAWYDGDLKRCIVPITTAESYTAAHWTSAVLGQDVSDLKSAFESFEDTAEKRIDGDTHSATINGTTGIVGNSSAAVVYVFEIEDEVYTLSFHGGNVRRYGFSNLPFAIGVTVNDLKTKNGSVILDDNREVINNTNGYKYLYAMATSNKSSYPGSLELLKRTDFVTNKTLNELIEQKNIINFNALLEQGWNREANGITVSLNTNGSFHVSGTATQNGNVLIINETYLNQIIEDGKSYFLTGTPYGSDCYVRYYQDDSQGIYSDRDGRGIQFTGKANVNKNITIYTLEGTTVDFDMFIQVNEGDIFDYYESPNGTPIDIVARANKTMNIVPIMISRVFREDVIPGYRFQSIAYDTDKSVFYIGCSSKEKNGQSLILVSDNLFNLYDADQYAVIAGHINDMTYDHVNQRLLAVSGKNEDGVAENPPGGNTVIVIETTNMTVTDVVTLNEIEYAISICSGDNVIYVYNLYAIYTYDTNFNLLNVSRNIYSSKIGQELRQLTQDQGMFWDGEYIYKVYNDSREIQPRANVVLGRINPNGFYFDKVIVAPINTGAEAQGIVSVDGNLYILCDGVFGSVSIARVAENLIAPKPTRIPENTDLNKLLAFGKWFCPSSSVCNTLLNLPPNEGIEHSFSLTIEEQGASWVRQTITVSSGTDTLYCAYYTRVCKNDGVWLPWVKFTGSILTT